MYKIYVCSPYRGDKEKNIENCKRYCEHIALYGNIPIAPHLYFTTFLDDDSILDRSTGMRMGQKLLRECDEVHVFANEVTEGMLEEIHLAHELNIPIKYYDAAGKELYYESLIINGDIGPGLRTIITDDFERCSGAKGCTGRCGSCSSKSKEKGNRASENGSRNNKGRKFFGI